jgi:YD repeat-containing protein
LYAFRVRFQTSRDDENSTHTFVYDERRPLTAIKERDGISESEPIRRAITAWNDAKAVTGKSTGRRGGEPRGKR